MKNLHNVISVQICRLLKQFYKLLLFEVYFRVYPRKMHCICEQWLLSYIHYVRHISTDKVVDR